MPSLEIMVRSGGQIFVRMDYRSRNACSDNVGDDIATSLCCCLSKSVDAVVQ